MTAPLVTVLMPAHDAAAYVTASVRSVLGQSFADFELLVVDDGSTDGTSDLLAAIDNPRLRVVRQANAGIAASLNAGIELARGTYIARHDADDVMLPERLARQVAFLDEHPEVVACGTWYELTGARSGVVRTPVSNAACRARLAFGTCFAHPSAMLRARVLRDHGLRYDPALEPAEDYGLFSELAELGELANLPFVGLRYRVHPEQASSAQAHVQRAATLRIAGRNLRRRGVRRVDDDALAAALWLDGHGVAEAVTYAVLHAPGLVRVAARADGRRGALTALQYVREQLNSALRARPLGIPNS